MYSLVKMAQDGSQPNILFTAKFADQVYDWYNETDEDDFGVWVWVLHTESIVPDQIYNHVDYNGDEQFSVIFSVHPSLENSWDWLNFTD